MLYAICIPMKDNYTPLSVSHKDHEAARVHAKYRHAALRALLFSVFLLLMVFGYNFLQMGQSSLRVWNRSFADTGMLLIGMSFALSGLCYFFSFLDSKILYRRDLGLNGFYLVAIHGFYSFMFSKFIPWFKYFDRDRLLAFIPAAVSLLIFLGMSLISNKYAAKKLGSDKWRALLRVGYIAYILGAAHAVLWGFDDWQEWFGTSTLPPISLIIVVFATFVLLLRIALWLALKKGSKK